MKKEAISLALGFLLVFSALVYTGVDFNLRARLTDPTTVAACPTWHGFLPKLEVAGFETIKTKSTGQSVRAFRVGEADLFISGRPLRPEEPDLEGKRLGDGYSFISKESRSLMEDELSEIKIKTDLGKERILSDFPQIDNLKKTENVYSDLEGVVITSYENTDYSKAEPVGVFDEYGQRLEKSRRPTLYYPKENKNQAKEINSILNL